MQQVRRRIVRCMGWAAILSSWLAQLLPLCSLTECGRHLILGTARRGGRSSLHHCDWVVWFVRELCFNQFRHCPRLWWYRARGRRRHRRLACRRSNYVAAVPILYKHIAWEQLTILTVFVTVG
jgi:hypothetical protein